MISISAFFLHSNRCREGVMELPFRIGCWYHFRSATENLWRKGQNGW